MLKQFIVKLFLLIVLSLILFIGSIVGIPMAVSNKISVPEQFILKVNEADILICGDSRADRQLNPTVINEMTGLRVVNFASTGQDLYTWSKALVAASVHDKTIVISASFFQINDGANSPTAINLSTFQDMNFSQKLKMYKMNVPTFFMIQTKLANAVLMNKLQIRLFGNYRRELNEEFTRKKCNPFSVDIDWMKSHGWYARPNISGVKRIFLEKAMHNFSKLKNCRIVIYNGPISNSFKILATQTGIMDLEKLYDSEMKQICNKFGFSYKTFIEDLTVQSDDLFYDPQHLCDKGAQLFSEKMSSILLALPK